MSASAAELEDYWAVLGLEPGASQKDVQKSYRKKSFAVHPDRYKGDDPEGATAEFLRLTRAKEVLEDDKARAAFEALRRARAMHKEKMAAQDSARRKLREDLEAREEAARKRQRTPGPVGGPSGGGSDYQSSQEAQQAAEREAQQREAAARAELQHELERLRRTGRLGGGLQPARATGRSDAAGTATTHTPSEATATEERHTARAHAPSQPVMVTQAEFERLEALTMARLRKAAERQRSTAREAKA